MKGLTAGGSSAGNAYLEQEVAFTPEIQDEFMYIEMHRGARQLAQASLCVTIS